jgi:hypothetical protein
LYDLCRQLLAIKKGIDFGIAGRQENSIGNLGGKKPQIEKGENPRLNLQRACRVLWPDQRDNEEDCCEEP